MKRKRRWLGALALAALTAVAYTAHEFVHLAAGYVAKQAGSAVFVAGRPLEDVRRVELIEFDWIDVSIEGDRIEAGAFGIRRVARHRPGLGVTLLVGDDDELRPASFGARGQAGGDPGRVEEPLDATSPRLEAALTAAMRTDPELGLRPWAVLVRSGGRIVGEKYSGDLGPDSVLVGWSMAKCVTGTMAGLLVRDGLLDVAAPAPVAEWSAPGDPRGAITTDMLLRMSSGLEFREAYTDPFADALRMLFGSGDMAGYSAALPLDLPPDTRRVYSSGTSNVLARILCERLGGSEGFLAYAHRELFGPLGMHAAIWELDAAGTPVGSSYVHATARGWSRFGQLYLDRGRWEGRQLLPESWIDYAATATPTDSRGGFGAHLWVNTGRDGRRPWPDVPADAISAQGHAGQLVVAVPSRDVVLVRLAADRDTARFDPNAWVTALLEALH